jgi:hypothetical protein
VETLVKQPLLSKGQINMHQTTANTTMEAFSLGSVHGLFSSEPEAVGGERVTSPAVKQLVFDSGAAAVSDAIRVGCSSGCRVGAEVFRARE